jgi:uncharacterized protein YqeY
MTLKEQISSDAVQAMKQQNKEKTSALRNLKSKITEMEKKTGIQDLSDADVLKVIVSAVKQRKDSVEQFQKANRLDLVATETFEMELFEQYLPKKLSAEERANAISDIVSCFPSGLPKQVLIGKTIGELNKRYSGQIDVAECKKEIEVFVESL